MVRSLTRRPVLSRTSFASSDEVAVRLFLMPLSTTLFASSLTTDGRPDRFFVSKPSGGEELLQHSAHCRPSDRFLPLVFMIALAHDS